MVFIPFLNIEVPEPRILELIPDTVVAVLRICSGIVTAARNTVYPLSPEQQVALLHLERESLPREFDRVFTRQFQGKIKNDEQLSSELEDASYDYYRRMLRTSIVGASDEEHEEFVHRNLFGTPQDAHEEVLALYARQHPEALADTEDIAELLGMELPTQDTPAELHQSLTALRERRLHHQEQLHEQAQEISRLRSSTKTAMAQARRSVLNGGLGVGLALLVFKGVGLGLKRALKAIKKAKRKSASGARPAAPPSRQAARQSREAPQPSPRQSSGGGSRPAAAVAAASTAQASSSGRTAQEQKPAEQQQPARRTRTSTRTR